MFQFRGLGALFGKLSPPKVPRGDETGFRFGAGVIKLSLAMYPFSISIDEHVLKISYDKKAVENNKNAFTNKHIMILKIIFTDVCVNISKRIIYKHVFPLLLQTSNVPLQIGKFTPTSLGVHVPQCGNP